MLEVGFRSIIAQLLLGLAICTVLVIGTHGPVFASSSMFGMISNEKMWEGYKQRFISPAGRVVDNANANISHSEGQGFGLLLAVAANDLAVFQQIWRFTYDSLRVRNDNLFAWRWKPKVPRPVSDKNNATDGDILIAWALLEATEAGFGDAYRKHALKILGDLKSLVHKDKIMGNWIRPGMHGFAKSENAGKEVINLSYWVFPALERLSHFTNDPLWETLGRSGIGWLAKASNNAAGLPTDWSAFRPGHGQVLPAKKSKPEFSYNAIRIPLYLAWSSAGHRLPLRQFQVHWVKRSTRLSQVDVRKNSDRQAFFDRGYRAIAAVINCSVSGNRFPNELRSELDKLYYPATLHLLSIIIIKQRYPKCW